jgi:AraC-like DNA-binding protein
MLQTIVNITGMNAIAQAILLSAFFSINKRGLRTSNRILAALLLVFGLVIFSTLPGASYKFGSYYKISFILRRIAFLIAPLFYFYIKSLVDVKFRLRPKDTLHFIPFVVFLGLTLFQALVLHVWQITFVREYYAHTFAILVHNAIYIGLSLRFLKQRRITLKALFAESNDLHVKWMRFFILGYLTFWLINFHNLFLLNVLKISSWCPYAGSIYCLIPFVFFNVIAFIALLKPEVFKNRIDSVYISTNLASRYQNRLLAAMESQKLYLNTDLSMVDMARDLSIPAKHLSYVINTMLHSNFYDFINFYRIEESKGLLVHPETGKKNILQIAFCVGFNSKSTFNAAFKKHTGMTPSEFRKQNGTRMKTTAVKSPEPRFSPLPSIDL